MVFEGLRVECGEIICSYEEYKGCWGEPCCILHHSYERFCWFSLEADRTGVGRCRFVGSIGCWGLVSYKKGAEILRKVQIYRSIAQADPLN